jgi:hypothetical protein
LCVLNFIGGFAGFFFACFGLFNEVIVVITGFVVNLVVLILVARPVLKEKSTHLWNLSLLIIPFGLIALFAFLGFETFEALDRAYPSF